MASIVTLLECGEYIGSVQQVCTVRGAMLAETRYAARATLPPHRHTGLTIFMIVRGELTERARGSSVCYPPGTFAYHPGGEVHGGQFGVRPGKGFHIELTHENETAHGVSLTRRLASHDEQRVSALVRQLQSELRRCDSAQALALEGAVLQLIASLVRARPLSADRRSEVHAVRRAEEMLGERARGAADWQAIATECGLPAAELFRAFQNVLGCTPAGYVRRRRAQNAARALSGGTAPISSVALDAGYYDQAHFTRAFKAQFGTTPSEYRRMTRTGG